MAVLRIPQEIPGIKPKNVGAVFAPDLWIVSLTLHSIYLSHSIRFDVNQRRVPELQGHSEAQLPVGCTRLVCIMRLHGRVLIEKPQTLLFLHPGHALELTRKLDSFQKPLLKLEIEAVKLFPAVERNVSVNVQHNG